ncbi:hypothetical protein DFH07DRAFT_757729 [Mycena maculata]|uniref:LysM domain-containing protein n=1 Tax=Mycena maculata TaxID=230809 RepID=A0AAD7HSF6_9AGAR|nr:hypothetical protein DFH07DRAFT_757729 [Mycena maculata]
MSLCLACSSSLPPKSVEPIFSTPCCSRPICPSCISANPRLARYDPCLACLGGVGVFGARKAQASTPQAREPASRNVDGAVRDEDTFVLGDDEDEEDAEPPQQSSKVVENSAPVESSPVESAPYPPSKYYIKRVDTLQGISLRFGIDGRELCRLNNLPPSTLSTTPHLLHTRGFLTLPHSAQNKLQESDARPDSADERAREVRRVRERAEKRLQTLTKEVDWRVAKAYIALADESSAADAFALKQKELGTPAATGLEAVAVDHYLDDMEWEQEQLRAGHGPHIPALPPLKEQMPIQSSSKGRW